MVSSRILQEIDNLDVSIDEKRFLKKVIGAEDDGLKDKIFPAYEKLICEYLKSIEKKDGK